MLNFHIWAFHTSTRTALGNVVGYSYSKIRRYYLGIECRIDMNFNFILLYFVLFLSRLHA